MAQIKGGTVYIGRDNTIDWQLMEDFEPLSAGKSAAITRARFEAEAVTIDSDDTPGLVAGLGTDTLRWRLGGVPELAPLAGKTIPVRLVVFAADYPNGLAWLEGIQVAVR